MSQFAQLALILSIGLAGPVLAVQQRLRIPVAIGEILAGVICGPSVLNLVKPSASGISLLSDLGFAVVMLVAGSHIDVRKFFGSHDALAALLNIALVTSASIIVAVALNLTHVFSHPAIAALVMSSSSAALVLPILANRRGQPVDRVVLQVAIADLACILAIPLVTDPAHVGRSLIGSLSIVALSMIVYAGLHRARTHSSWTHVRTISKQHRLGLELRISLIVLVGFVAIAQNFHFTILIAGFAGGLALAANGVPHRLASQLFDVSEGFLAPVFFVVLGTRIDVGAALSHSKLFMLAIALGGGAIISHLVVTLTGTPRDLAVASAAQLGIPAAIVTVGQSTGILNSGQNAAIMLGAMITIAVTAIATRGSAS